MEYTQLSLFGKMSPELSAQTKAKISGQFSKKSAASQTVRYQFLNLTAANGLLQEKLWEIRFQSHGECLTRNTGASPKEERESFLSRILEAGAPEKYYLSVKACQGILRRALKRGKELPEVLRIALETQIKRLSPPDLRADRAQKPEASAIREN
jgi:hypothetical protein